ncbi:uncharacterized protein MELLADRAFT_66912 [Melampsora larici-populina 98AG31]|uniref:F-box domain-containing protein n=1 Tax=Melampsora larici-populina (strain 98AG31 / pathotype 3-4-7) TaxID=747676 RepID=F4S130_MELLP|nr:uncharacterized protein MELLADRAFT_66912 [Melampsora larici-populina 98AG31]EGG01711.1 hypothetical protein MELLADRAFT_66912 [Melampsora larici-populina 98AG31]
MTSQKLSTSFKGSDPAILRLPDEVLDIIIRYAEQEFFDKYYPAGTSSPRPLYRITSDNLPRTRIRSLLIVCRKFFYRIEPFVYNVIVMPPFLNPSKAMEITDQIGSHSHPHWLRGLRIGTLEPTTPLIEPQRLAECISRISVHLHIIHLDGLITDSFLSAELYPVLTQLASLSTLELSSPSQTIDITRILKTIFHLPQLKSLFLSLGDFSRLPAILQSSEDLIAYCGSIFDHSRPPLVNLAVQFSLNNPPRLDGLAAFLGIFAPTLRVLRLRGNLGPGLSGALSPVAGSLHALEIAKIDATLEGAINLSMDRVQTLVLGHPTGFVPYFQWRKQLFKSTSTLVLQFSNNLRPATIEPLIDPIQLQRLILVDFSGREYNKSSSQPNTAMFDWCAQHSIKLSVIARVSFVDHLFQKVLDEIMYVRVLSYSFLYPHAHPMCLTLFSSTCPRTIPRDPRDSYQAMPPYLNKQLFPESLETLI